MFRRTTASRIYAGLPSQASLFKRSSSLLLARPVLPRLPPQTRGVVVKSNWNENKSRAKDKSVFKNRIVLGLLILMPIVSFGLGTWQVKRLKWKLDLITRAEENLRKPADTLAADIDARDLDTQDYTRVKIRGHFDHANEQLVGPRVFNGRRGFLVVTPLVRDTEVLDPSKPPQRVLVVRGWISTDHKDQKTRPLSVTNDVQNVECLVREKPNKNYFTPEGPRENEYHFMDIDAMAAKTNSDAVYLEEIMPEQADYDKMCYNGVPIGAVPTVAYRNTHFQYIMTWYGISAFSAIMLFVMWKQRRPVNPIAAKMAHAKKWQ